MSDTVQSAPHRLVVAPHTIPFGERPTCTIAEACEATGLGRSKLYELIGEGRIDTTTIGRRRLVRVPSLLRLVEG
jgi:excisionase family DNA binding protein